MSERIQKVLARAGVGSRRQVEAWIREGRLAINGAPAVLGAQIGPRDRITLDDRPLRLRQPDSDTRVVIYHRGARRAPATPESRGEVRADRAEGTDDPFDLHSRLPKRAGRRWIPVSPLPPNDSGLELLTSDGELAQALMRKFSSLEVEFALRVRGEPRPEQLEHLQSGTLDDGTAVRVETVEPAGGEGLNRWLKLVTRGGRARDVHRLCAVAGIELSRLIRVGLGPLRMDRSLARERLRPLGPAEMTALYRLAGVERTSRGAAGARTGSPSGEQRRVAKGMKRVKRVQHTRQARRERY